MGPDIGDLLPRSAPVQLAQPQQNVPGTAANKMLDDPDTQTIEWEDDTFADSQTAAEENCRLKAEKMTQDGGTLVRSLGARQISGNLFKCKLSSEVPNDGN